MCDLVTVELTRSELVVLKEIIEDLPRFEGRTDAREAVRQGLRGPARPAQIRLDEVAAEALARYVVPRDLQSNVLRAKLKRALDNPRFTAEVR